MPLVRVEIEQLEVDRWVAECEMGRRALLRATSFEDMIGVIRLWYHAGQPPVDRPPEPAPEVQPRPAPEEAIGPDDDEMDDTAEDDTPDEPGAPPRPRRSRRTKAQMEAARAADGKSE